MIVEIIIGVVALIIVLIIITNIKSKNKLNFAILKIDEAESNLDVLLLRKMDLLERTIPIVKKELKLDDFLTELSFMQEADLNHFQMNDMLRSQYNELFKTLDENDKLFKSEALNHILRDLNDNEEAIVGSIKYYNDNVVIFNHLVTSFPSKIVAFFKHYKKKDFYSDEDKEMYEIINQ